MLVDHHGEISATLNAVEIVLKKLEETRGEGEENPRDSLTRLQNDLDQCESLVTQFDVSARATGNNTGRQQAKTLKTKLIGLKERAAKLDLLMGAVKITGSREENAFHDKFANTNRTLEASTERLIDSRRTLVDTEGVAFDIAENLLEQRNTIQSSRDKIFTTGNLMGTAHRAMKSLEKRETQRKVCVYVSVAIVVFAIFVSILRIVVPRTQHTVTIVITPSPTTLSPTPHPTMIPSTHPTLHPTTSIPTTSIPTTTSNPATRRRRDLLLQQQHALLLRRNSNDN
jgi:hypothetical protein